MNGDRLQFNVGNGKVLNILIISKKFYLWYPRKHKRLIKVTSENFVTKLACRTSIFILCQHHFPAQLVSYILLLRHCHLTTENTSAAWHSSVTKYVICPILHSLATWSLKFIICWRGRRVVVMWFQMYVQTVDRYMDKEISVSEKLYGGWINLPQLCPRCSGR